ncbi:hypothetical protein FRC12_004414 [Ceratobasidium sp. 428]|nr:hypothetical protein FRC09_003321 [Ceratobasidium sp. 395]KAG8770247.1 hypothetical protein FRC12_004414 [Ceratobasidium sp. 428]
MAGQDHELPVGTRVYYYDGEGQASYGQVSSFEFAQDGTKIARVRLEGSESVVALPLAFVTVVSTSSADALIRFD